MSRAAFVAIEEMNAEIAALDAANAELRAQLAAARAAERERCAKVCSNIARERAVFQGPERGPVAWRASSEADGATACAVAIRAMTDGEEV